jgi:hypothetical protein
MYNASNKYCGCSCHSLPLPAEKQDTPEKDSLGYGCKNSCGLSVRFDNQVKSQNGKHIPLNASNGLPHMCPKRPLFPANSEAARFRSNLGQAENLFLSTKTTLSTNVHAGQEELRKPKMKLDKGERNSPFSLCSRSSQDSVRVRRYPKCLD